MNKMINPASIAPPFSKYSHGVESAAGARILQISGQVGVAPNGSVPTSFAEQAELAWQNIEAILAGAGMGIRDLVKVTTYIVDRANLPVSREVRDRHLKGHPAAATLVVVAGLANPAWEIEIEACAARAAATSSVAKKARTVRAAKAKKRARRRGA
jgi:enamine deaminase RidA (YjgF/YER057c/UK114 family)